ncbi:virion structural protein [Vibrio phage vB_VpS_BA3]|nr:hypothetical protein VspDsh1_46 [Vibrio phage VspDsh_1]QEQ95123.1 virion structural protein [Vibrio phage vB_VpS_BA3]
MAITVETGSGVAGADSYVSVVEADSYFARFGNTVWSGKSTEQKETALKVASSYADSRWAARISAAPLKSDQGLSLPANGLYSPHGAAVSGIPVKWKQAVMEYALQSFSGDLWKTATQADVSGKVKSERVTVGPITTKTEFAATTGAAVLFKRYPKADALVKAAFMSKGSGGRVIR